jgi:hypothetical protein
LVYIVFDLGNKHQPEAATGFWNIQKDACLICGSCDETTVRKLCTDPYLFLQSRLSVVIDCASLRDRGSPFSIDLVCISVDVGV